MNNYEDWALLVAKKLKGEADLIAAIEKDELEDSAAQDAFVRAVLEPFLPENYGVGSGRIVDAFGNYSDHLEVIVYNRDFPRIGMRGINDAYLYESVLATFSVRAKFIRKTFFASLDACASLAELETNMDKTVLIRLAKKNGLKPGPNKKFVHEDPLRTARFDLIGRPPGFVFGFSGIKNSYRQLQENIELWIDHRQNDGMATPMKALPAVIATQGCFAWRNAAPLALSNREMLGIGNDEAPIRLIVLQLLYLLNRRLHITADGYGLKPNLNAYLSQFSGPKFELGVGNVYEMENMKSARDTMRFEPAKDHTPVLAAAPAPKPATPEPAQAPKEVTPVSAAPEPAPAPKEAAPVNATPEPPLAPKEATPVNTTPEPPPAPKEVAPVNATPEPPPAPKEAAPVNKDPGKVKAVPAEESRESSAPAAAFDKPSPFASAPGPSTAQESTPEPAPAASSGVFDKPSPFASAPAPQEKEVEAEPPRPAAKVSSLGSAPIPPMSAPEPEAKPEPAPMPSTPLGSAPIPPMSDPEPAPKPEPAPMPSAPLGSAPIPPSEPNVNKVIPPKPPVDFDLGSEPEVLEDKVQTEEDDFESTVIIPPNAGASSNVAAKDSTNAFIARVKEQLSSEPEIEKEQKSFSSTIPQ